MADCREQVYSNDYFDFIIAYGEAAYVPATQGCVQRIDEDYDTLYYPREGLPEFSVKDYTYTAIPKCYGLLDRTALEASGIIRMQEQPALSLKGDGVLMGFIDTGIDYTNPLFRYADGSSRIIRLWDQTIENGEPPEGIIYGAEYTQAQISEALKSGNPYSMVPSRDENGHGTFLAGVACGGENIGNDFIGAAPNADIAVVKLKEAKQYLRDYFFIPEGAPAFQENDIMLAIAYLNRLAATRNQPLVICIALGTASGSHGAAGNLASYLNDICRRRQRAIVVATGNEANTRHHFSGRIIGDMEYEEVEINVEADMDGFVMELWAASPELFAVSVISPTGEQVPKIPVRPGVSETYDFIFERTTVTIDYRIESKNGASQLTFFRFIQPKRGVWRVRVYPQSTITGLYNIWLPLQQFTGGNVFFLRSNPDTTLTIPSAAQLVITVGGYNSANNSIYADSGRGFTITGVIKPDFTAPAVNVFGPGRHQDFTTYTGTSVAAAITSGACAQVFQWALVEQNQPQMSNAALKNMLIRGTQKMEGINYPNRQWGYGTLDVYNAFRVLQSS